MKKHEVVWSLILLCGCVQDQHIRINDENVFDHLQITRGSSLYGNEFFKSASNKPLGECKTNIKSCTQQQLSLGEKIDAQYYDIWLIGLNMNVTHVWDKLLTAAAMVAFQEGYRFITPLDEAYGYNYSESPEDYTDCTSIGYSVYCSTSRHTKSSLSQTYNLGFIAYNNYEDIKPGILIYDNDKIHALPFFPLYRKKEPDTLSRDSYDNNEGTRIYYKEDAWKTKYDVSEIINGEQVEIKQFNFKDEQIVPHISIADKYKQ